MAPPGGTGQASYAAISVARAQRRLPHCSSGPEGILDKMFNFKDQQMHHKSPALRSHPRAAPGVSKLRRFIVYTSYEY